MADAAMPCMHLVKCRTNLTPSVHQSRSCVKDLPDGEQDVPGNWTQSRLDSQAPFT